MYSRQQYDEMTHAEAQDAFTALCQEYFGDRVWKKQLLETGIMTRPGIQNWFRSGDTYRPPFWAFCLIAAWIEAKDAAAHVRAIRDAVQFANDFDERI